MKIRWTVSEKFADYLYLEKKNVACKSDNA